MNIQQLKLYAKENLFFSTLLVMLTLTNNLAHAQKAPPFSNNILMDNQTYVFLWQTGWNII